MLNQISRDVQVEMMGMLSTQIMFMMLARVRMVVFGMRDIEMMFIQMQKSRGTDRKDHADN